MERNSRPETEQRLTSNDLQPDLTCNSNEESETSAQLIPNASNQVDSTAYI